MEEFGPHVHREFFTGHKLPIVYLLMIENGTNFVSIDKNGHIFVWTYNAEKVNKKKHFEPS